MILVLGGTTEGRKAAAALEEAGSTFFYSTKGGEQQVVLHHGIAVSGALSREGMVAFCHDHDIRLLVDASHPFATALHQTVADVADELCIPVVRYERIFPPHDDSLTWLDDIGDLTLPPSTTLLATTGVKSIARLKPLEALGIHIVYRILPRESSIRLAHEQGATDDQLCFYEEGGTIDTDADAILLKESGLSGGFCAKVQTAKERGMKVFVVKRPPYPTLRRLTIVNGPHGLRRSVEKLLPEFYPRHSGLTTGTCATAAAIGATRQLLCGSRPEEVMVTLPDGEQIPVAVGYREGYAFVVKDGGDDPDVTDGVEVRVTAERSPHFEIVGGEGVGRFTLPGFDYPPGEAAINRSPRQMIEQNLRALLAPLSPNIRITISVPGGEAIAQKTFNPRLGIVGGISIIGVSGIVKPFSEEAFIMSIRKCMEVAKASGSRHVVINSGGKSERYVKGLHPELPQQAFVEYGNYVGATLKMAADLHIPHITLGLMLGKAVKLAAGHLDTHSRRATMDKDFIGRMLREAAIDVDISAITLARELWDRIPKRQLPAFVDTVKRHCHQHCDPLFPDGELTILLIDDQGNIF